MLLLSLWELQNWVAILSSFCQPLPRPPAPSAKSLFSLFTWQTTMFSLSPNKGQLVDHELQHHKLMLVPNSCCTVSTDVLRVLTGPDSGISYFCPDFAHISALAECHISLTLYFPYLLNHNSTPLLTALSIASLTLIAMFRTSMHINGFLADLLVLESLDSVVTKPKGGYWILC